MGNKFWEKCSHFIGILPIGALFGLVVFVANIEIQDYDLWLHLAMGKYIVTNAMIPLEDVLSASIIGKVWINHEWLFQVLVFKIFEAWGPDGLIKMQVVVVTLTMLILLVLGYNRDRQLVTTFGLLLVFLHGHIVLGGPYLEFYLN